MKSRTLLKYAVAAVVFVIFSHSVQADVVTLNNGDEIFGTLLSADPLKVILEKDGKPTTYVATEVMKLEFESFRMIPDETTLEAVRDPLIKDAIQHPPTVEKYPQALRVDVLDEDRYDIASDGTWLYQAHDAFVVLKESAREDANRSFTYFPDLETYDIRFGRSITPGSSGGPLGLFGKSGGTVRYVSDRTIADEADFTDTPLYSRRRTVKFAIPEVNEGTLVEAQYQVHRKELDPFKPFYVEKYFRGSEPKRVSRLVISVPRTMKLLYAIEERGTPLQVEHREEGDRIVHVFTATETAPFLSEPLMPDISRIAPRVICSLDDTWEDVAGRYNQALEKIRGRAVGNADLKKTVEKVIGRESDPEKKARALFEYVGKEIAQLGISPGAFTHEPIDPVKVLGNRQGTLFDKAFFFHVLLTIAKVENRLLLVCPVESGEWEYTIPNLRQATDMAVEIPGLKGPLAMNLPTSEYLSPDIRPASLQGARGIRLPKGDPVLIPNIEAAGEGEILNMDAEIREDGTLLFRETTRSFGNTELSLRTLKSYRQEEIQKMFQEGYHANFPGSVLKKLELENLQDINKPIVIRTEVEVPGFALKSGNDLLVIPVPVSRSEYSAAEVGAPVRRVDMTWPTFSRQEKRISLKLPPGYVPYALPAGAFASADGLVYHSAFGFELGKVFFNDVTERCIRDYSAKAYASYKNYIETRAGTTNQWIIIRKGG